MLKLGASTGLEALLSNQMVVPHFLRSHSLSMGPATCLLILLLPCFSRNHCALTRSRRRVVLSLVQPRKSRQMSCPQNPAGSPLLHLENVWRLPLLITFLYPRQSIQQTT